MSLSKVKLGMICGTIIAVAYILTMAGPSPSTAPVDRPIPVVALDTIRGVVVCYGDETPAQIIGVQFPGYRIVAVGYRDSRIDRSAGTLTRVTRYNVCVVGYSRAL
jgi:hypothetical protein